MNVTHSDLLETHSVNMKVGTLSFLGAILLNLGLFLLIPLTQQIEIPDNDQQRLQLNQPVLLPPPDAPSKPLPKVESFQPSNPQKPKLKHLAQQDPLKGLELQLDIGPGVNLELEGYKDIAIETDIDVTQAVREMFTFEDLTTPPRYLTKPNIIYPRELSRRGIWKVTVVLLIEINEDGKAKTLEVISSTHPRAIPEAKNVINKTPFTKPIVNGKPQKVIGQFSVVLQALR
jgi:hypothetical protein